MERAPAYPNPDIRREGEDAHAARHARTAEPRALISSVLRDSPAYDAGFEPGCFLVSVDGRPLRDIIDWRWYSAGDEIVVGYIDLDGERGEVELWRQPGEQWGFEFEGLVFDGVKQCRNACTFCFMHQLPHGMRKSLYLRDDDFRLSFLVGTFVTLTNLSAEDEARIIEQRISPLRVSLQVTDADARCRLIGKHAPWGLAALERLLAAGIEFHAQIVLVPEGNDGDLLEKTLEWAYERPGILNVGIVPLGFTRHQKLFDHSFNEEGSSREVLDLIAPFQARAVRQRGHAWVHAADEFYRNAYGKRLLDYLPPASHYGDFAMFEDGIGIIRSTVEDWGCAMRQGALKRCRQVLEASKAKALLIAGFAQREFLSELVGRSQLEGLFEPLYVANDFFGGNVDVTGLLVGADIARAVRKDSSGNPDAVYFVPSVVFNDDGLTLDDMTVSDMEKAAGVKLAVVSCSPKDYFVEIADYIAAAGINDKDSSWHCPSSPSSDGRTSESRRSSTA